MIALSPCAGGMSVLCTVQVALPLTVERLDGPAGGLAFAFFCHTLHFYVPIVGYPVMHSPGLAVVGGRVFLHPTEVELCLNCKVVEVVNSMGRMVLLISCLT